MMTNELYTIYSTFATRKEAISVVRALLARRLVACANVGGEVTSLYRWKGDIAEEKEVPVLFKTCEEKLPEAMAAIESLHSYEIPCVVAYKTEGANPDFIRWVEEEMA